MTYLGLSVGRVETQSAKGNTIALFVLFVCLVS